MKARESFFFGMIPVLFPILSDRCRNSVVFFNYCFTDTHLKHAGAFLSAALAAATGEAGGDIPPQKAEDAACHQGQEGAAKRRADVEPHAGGGGEGGNQRRQQRPQGAHSGGLPAAEPGVRQGRRAVCQQAAQQIGQQAAKTGGSGGREKEQSRGRGGRQGQHVRAQQGEHQAAHSQGPQHQGQKITEAAFHRTSLSIKTRRSARRGDRPAVQPMRWVRRLCERVYIFIFF